MARPDASGRQLADELGPLTAGTPDQASELERIWIGANAYAERWVSTIRRECLDRMLIFGDRQLGHVLAEYENNYNRHRPHRAVEQLPPIGDLCLERARGERGVQRTEILGGLINEYRHAA